MGFNFELILNVAIVSRQFKLKPLSILFFVSSQQNASHSIAVLNFRKEESPGNAEHLAS